MKAEDLMIGDWVDVYHELPDESGFYKPLQVTGIHRNDGVCFGHSVIESPWIDPEEFDASEPIPLTKEILLKNGFEHFSGGGCIIKELDDNEIPTLYIWDGNNSIYVVDYYSTNRYTYIKECKYVHEFQHELKSCGIEKEIVL